MALFASKRFKIRETKRNKMKRYETRCDIVKHIATKRVPFWEETAGKRQECIGTRIAKFIR
jgi:hypothetical protein